MIPAPYAIVILVKTGCEAVPKIGHVYYGYSQGGCMHTLRNSWNSNNKIEAWHLCESSKLVELLKEIKIPVIYE